MENGKRYIVDDRERVREDERKANIENDVEEIREQVCARLRRESKE